MNTFTAYSTYQLYRSLLKLCVDAYAQSVLAIRNDLCYDNIDNSRRWSKDDYCHKKWRGYEPNSTMSTRLKNEIL